MTTLEEFIPLMQCQDTKKRLNIGADLLNFMSNPTNVIVCENFNAFIDAIIQWLQCSNFKVAQNGLEMLCVLAERMREDFRPYITTALPAAVDRMGDGKDAVREQSKVFMLKLMSCVASPQLILEKLIPTFSHKNWRVREEMLYCLHDSILRYGIGSSNANNSQLMLSKFIPSLVALLSDPNSQVRDTATTTLVEIYKHVGEKLRHDIIKKHSDVPQQKLQMLFAKFDDIASSGDLLPSVKLAGFKSGGTSVGYDDNDFKMIGTKSASKRATSAPPVKRNALPPQRILQSNSSSKSGAADEEMFMNAFEDVPRVQLFSSRDLEQELIKIKDICSDPSVDWEKRNESLKRIRSLLIAGADQYDEFTSFLKPLELPFQVSVKDLRSQVVREACITIAYVSQRIGNRCDRFAEALLPTLINLIQNSAKIMSSSAIVAIRFIIQYTHGSRLIPIITYNISAKSKEIRKACSEFLDQLLHTWPTHALEKHVAILQEAIKKGISDADAEARAYARKAFWGFADKFKHEADFLLNSLDSSKQRMLHGEQLIMSNSSSTNSLNQIGNAYMYPLRSQATRTASVSSSGSIENLVRPSSSLSSKVRSGIPIISPRNDIVSRSTVPSSPFRSTAESGSQRIAKARAAFAAAMAHPRINSGGYSLPRKRVDSTTVASAVISPERSRSKTRVSQSLPGSRSASPSSRLNYYTVTQPDGRTHRVRRKSGIPVSSREASPTRSGMSGLSSMERRLSSGSRGRYHTTSERQTPLAAEKILQQSKEAEVALESALRSSTTNSVGPYKRYNSYDDHSDESETSSICSDISFGSYGGKKVEDVSEIIHNLSSTHWSDRKEGLLSLAFLFRHTSRSLNQYELKRITDIFTKMLLDPHTKTFTLFLDILNDLILLYKSELSNWLYVLMTRLFLKIGSDTLGSIQNKILKTFDQIRESFLCDEQFNVIIRFLSDQTQTPNVKVKTAVLQYMINLIPLMESSDLSNGNRNNHETQLSLMKIISWTADPKSPELRKISQDVIMDLFNLNPAELSLIINALPKTYQDAALQVIDLKRRSRSESSTHSPLTSLRTPALLRTNPTNVTKHNYYDEMENLNPEDIYTSLKQTTDEIQKYSLNIDDTVIVKRSEITVNNVPQTLQYPIASPRNASAVKNLKDLSCASQDSGISQIDCASNSNNRMVSNSSPKKPLNSPLFQNGANSPDKSGAENFMSILSNLRGNCNDLESQKEVLNDLIELIREENSVEWNKHFKDIYRILLEKITEDVNSSIRALSLKALCDLLMKHTKYFNDFIELTILRILESSKDNEKEVIRAAEVAAGTAAAILPPEQCLKVLKSVIVTGENPVNIAAIKMLTKLIDQQPKDIIIELMPEMMPPLIQAYDNPESAVRKAAVFCMVSIHGVVGDSSMKPYLSALNGSKMKLLKLYIDRAKSQSTGGHSPISTYSS